MFHHLPQLKIGRMEMERWKYGKYISMRKPSNSDSLWCNYKGFFSMAMLTVCDARYCFSLVDVGEYGSNNDSGIFRNSKMGRGFGNGEMNIPESKKILGDDLELSYFCWRWDNFLSKMRPFSAKAFINKMRKIFSYRLSRTRRIIENMFGILVAYWKIFDPRMMRNLYLQPSLYTTI